MNIRSYKKEDFALILNLLNSNCDYDTFSEELLHEKLYDDPNWDANNTLVATEKNQIIGFLQGVIRDIRGTRYGYIKLMVVHKNWRRQSIATKLFKTIEDNFKKMEVENIRIYDSPLNYFMPGVDPRYTEAVCFAEKMGFKHIGEAVNMTVDLEKSNWETTEDIKNLKNENIEISRATNADKEELIEFISEEWILWQNELELAYKSNPIAIFIARLNGKIKAFSAYNGNNVGTGWFGPMGTHPDLRGNGIGKVLLYNCLADIKSSGLTESTIPWVAPISFYSHYADAKISRVFWRYEKLMKNE